jgi:hypothetical protein
MKLAFFLSLPIFEVDDPIIRERQVVCRMGEVHARNDSKFHNYVACGVSGSLKRFAAANNAAEEKNGDETREDTKRGVHRRHSSRSEKLSKAPSY